MEAGHIQQGQGPTQKEMLSSFYSIRSVLNKVHKEKKTLLLITPAWQT